MLLRTGTTKNSWESAPTSQKLSAGRVAQPNHTQYIIQHTQHNNFNTTRTPHKATRTTNHHTNTHCSVAPPRWKKWRVRATNTMVFLLQLLVVPLICLRHQMCLSDIIPHHTTQHNTQATHHSQNTRCPGMRRLRPCGSTAHSASYCTVTPPRWKRRCDRVSKNMVFSLWPSARPSFVWDSKCVLNTTQHKRR